MTNMINESFEFYSWDVPTTAKDFLKFVTDKLAEIPTPYEKSSVRVDIETEYDHGDSYGKLVIRFKRPETKEEEKERTDTDSIDNIRRVAAEKAELRRLIGIHGTDV